MRRFDEVKVVNPLMSCVNSTAFIKRGNNACPEAATWTVPAILVMQ